jgi:hypothetical protein
MTEIEFLRSEYQVLVGRIGLLSNLSLTLMELMLSQNQQLARPVLDAMRAKLAEKTYGGLPEISTSTLEFERSTFEAEIAPFLEAIAKGAVSAP